MRKKIIILISLLMTLWANVCFAYHWEYYGDASDGTRFSIDTDSVVTQGNTKYFLILEEFSDIRIAGMKYATLSIAMTKEPKTYTIRQTAVYDQKGNLLGSQKIENPVNSDFKDNYLMEILHKKLFPVESVQNPAPVKTESAQPAAAAATEPAIHEATGNEEAASEEPEEEESTPSEIAYVGNVRSHKFHVPGCRWERRMSDGNKVYFSSWDEAEEAGYKPCQTCL